MADAGFRTSDKRHPPADDGKPKPNEVWWVQHADEDFPQSPFLLCKSTYGWERFGWETGYLDDEIVPLQQVAPYEADQ